MRYRFRGVFSFGGWWPPGSCENSNPHYSRHFLIKHRYAYGAITLYGKPFQKYFHLRCLIKRKAHNTTCPLRDSVWTLSFSIAFTHDISFDFSSSPYWDVSIRGVPNPYGSLPKKQEVLLGYLRIIGSMRLPGAYRSLARPSSALEPSHPLTGLYQLVFFDCVR